MMTPTGKTRQDMKKLSEKREYNRLAQQQCRANWSQQKQTEINAKKREEYLMKRSEKSITLDVSKEVNTNNSHATAAENRTENVGGKRSCNRTLKKVRHSINQTGKVCF